VDDITKITEQIPYVVDHGPLKLRTSTEVITPEVYKGIVSEQNVFPGSKEDIQLCTHNFFLAQLLSSPRSYSLPKSTTYTVVKSQFLGLQLTSKILGLKI
jgi:hypothetical protein